MSGLYSAACSGNTQEVNRLISEGVDVNAYKIDRSLPHLNSLHCAARNGHTKVVEALIKAGADVNATDSNNETPLHYAARNGHKE